MRTNIIRQLHRETQGGIHENRKGIFLVVTAFAVVAVMSFMALSVDIGVISLTKTNLQNCADAAALAAAQEIMAAVESAGEGLEEGEELPDINSLSVEASKEMARKVVELNGFFIDKDADVYFGRRTFNEDTEQFEIIWGTPPFTGAESFNVVKVRVRMDNPDMAAPDHQLQLFFAGVASDDTVSLYAEAIAFVEARDISIVMDYSGSMNDDSAFRSIGKLSQSSIEANMGDIFEALNMDTGTMTETPTYFTQTKQTEHGPVSVTFKNTAVDITTTEAMTDITLEFEGGGSQDVTGSGTSGTFSGIGGYSGYVIETVWVGTQKVESESSTNSNTVNGITVDVVFNDTSVDVACSDDMIWVRLYFDDGTSQKIFVSGDNASLEGGGDNVGKPINKVKVRSGSTRIVVREPDDAGQTIYTEESNEFSDSNENIQAYFGFDDIAWPYPSGSWNEFIEHCKWDGDIRDAGYRRMYGGLNMVDYLLERKASYSQCPDLWKTPHYPFHAAKNGTSLFCDFLDGLEFGDYLGLVTYATYSKIQTGLNDEYTDVTVDLGDEWLTSDYDKIDTIQRHKQASHFANTTGIGYGMEDAITLLDTKGRFGARPTILLMTDGLANQSPEDFSLPGDWNWNDLTDFDGDGLADYETDNRHKQYLFYQVKRAIDLDYTIHTMSVGAGADRDLMEAVAFAGRGEWIDVPGGSTVAEMEEQMLSAFAKIAANVPPAKLLIDPAELSP